MQNRPAQTKFRKMYAKIQGYIPEQFEGTP